VTALADALRLLAGRELSVAECRARLLDREHPPPEVDAALERLQEDGALDDRRVARAYARTAVAVKGRGRLRVQRELVEKGIARDIAAEAVAEVFGELDERSLVARAVQKKLRHGARPSTTAERARLYQHLLRQGFSPAVVSAELRKLRKGPGTDDGSD
jgi:regulatory protein